MGKVKKSPSPLREAKIPKTMTGRKVPKCGRCYIHGVVILLSGHKKYCQFQNCECPRCYIFLAEQRLAADKIAQKRAYELSKLKKISHLEVSISLFCQSIRSVNRKLVIIAVAKID
ncbi:Doublesex- and mab-3-related transcription factor 3 [Cyphomyrmex costatus]|uniref:Doublesex-and mab-3-related transcription factor 3 n=1 Tax=Cyphomyrmex costatus TaxID=456900 RepID=A0A195CG97_9HYME|nr:Doublesex- and mab-3-related transcription factor 3 [Cyphomyrmex costatus]